MSDVKLEETGQSISSALVCNNLTIGEENVICVILVFSSTVIR